MKKIRIAVDCSRLNTEHRTGTHRFLISFLRELNNREGVEIVYFFNYLNPDYIKDLEFLRDSRIEVLKTSFYTQFGLLKYLKFYDHFIFPWQTLPFLGFLYSQNKIAIIHDSGFTFKTKFFTFLTQIFANKVFSVSISTSESLIVNSTLITEGVDEGTFNKLSLKNLNFEKQRLGVNYDFILSIGRIEERKNIFNNLRAFEKVQKFFPNLKYLFIGPFQGNEDEIYSFLKKYKLDRNNIVFKNYLNDQDLNSYLNLSEFLVFTSKEEGFGLPVLEAYRVEKPVILSRIKALAPFELSASQFCNPNNYEEIADRMVYFLQNKNKLAKQLDFESILEKFSWKNSVNMFLEGINKNND